MSGAQPADGEATTPRISIVVPTYNRARVLARLLRALERQTTPAEGFEVIVVDDGSTDATGSVLAEDYSYRLRALSQANAGPAAARNTGIACASGEIILFVDDDVIPRDDLIERHLAAHEGREVVAFGRMCPPAGGRKQPFWAEWELRTLEQQYAAMLSGAFKPTFRQFFTGNASLCREDLVHAGMFNPAFRRAEDVELGSRLEALPRDFVFADEAVVYHDTPRTLAGWVMMARQYGHYDALLSQLPGLGWLHECLVEELIYSRKRAVRAAVRLFAGRPLVVPVMRRVLPRLLQAVDAVGLRRLALGGCSLLFPLLYWHEFCRERGGRQCLSLPPASVEALSPAAVE